MIKGERFSMLNRLQQRLASEEGFTLIELLVVIVIIGILLAIAVPSYLGFRDKAANSAAQSNLRAIVPSAEAWYADNGGTATDIDGAAATTGYQGMTVALLKSKLDSGIKTTGNYLVTLDNSDADSYCFEATGKDLYSFSGPGGEVTKAAC
jgi:type IV pilus assembly protein PilA